MSLRSRAPKGEQQTLFGWLLTSSSLFRAEQELWKYVHFKFFCDTGILICATQTHAHHEVLRVTGIRSTPPGDGKTFSIDVDSVNPASPRKACHSNRRILVGTPDSKVCKEWVDNLTIYIQQLSSGCTEERKQLSNLEDMVPNTKVNCTLCQAMEATANGAGPRGGRRGAGSWRACAQCGRRWCPRCKRRGMEKVLLRPEVSAELQGHGPFGGGGGGGCLPLRRWGRPGGGAGARFGLCLPCAVIPGDRPTPSRCALCGDRLRPRSWPRPRRCARCLEVFCSGCRPRRRRAGDGEASTEACCALCLARGRIEHTLLDGDLERANTSTTVKKPKPEDEVVHHSLEKFKSQESPPPELSPFEKLRADKMYERFFKMQSYGVPGIAICQKMLMEGTDLEIIRLFAAGSNVSDEELEPILPISAKANDKAGHLRGLGPEAHPSSEVDEQKKTQLPKVPSPIKMRRFFWNPIRESSKGGAAAAAAGQGHRPLAGSVWRRATARRAAAPAAAAFRAAGGGGARGPDARGRQELARLFGGRGAQDPSLTTAPVADTNNGQRRAKNSAAALGKQAQPIRLLDPRRSQNMAIAAAQFKDMDYSAAAWAAVGLALDSRRVEVLAGALPTPEECAALLAHRGTTGEEDLAEGERLARALAAVPRLDAKFHTLRYYYSFERVLKQLDLEIGHVTKACLQILESEGLARVLETILAIGNLLNHGSEIGEAEGFSVDSLLKLSQTKSLDGSITLLDYFVQVIYEKGEDDILDLLGIEFTSLDAAYRLSDTVLTGQHRSLEMDLRKVQMEYELIQEDLQCKQTSNENNTCPSQSIQNVESSGHAMLQAIRTRKEAGALPSSARSSLLQAIQARGQSNDEPQISHCTKGQAHQNATGAGGSRSAMLQAIRARKEAGALPSSSRSSLLQAIQARGQSNDELQISHHDKGQANQSAVDAGGGRSAMLQAIRTRKEACAPLSSARSSLLQAIQARGQSSGKPQTSPDKRQDHQSALDAAGGGRSSMLQAILTRKEAGASPSSARSSLLQAIQALGQRNDEPQTSPDKGQAHQSAIDAGGGRSSAMLQAICTMKETNSPLCGARSSLFQPTQAREQNEMSSGPQTIPKKGQARHKKDADAPLSSARASTLQPIQLVNCNQNSLTVLVNDHDEQKIPAPTPFDTARNSICGSETSCLSFLSLDDEDQDQYDNHSYKCEKAELVDNLKIAQQRKSSGSIEGAGSFPCCEEQDTVNLGSPGHKSPIQVPGLGEHLEARPSITSSSDQSFCSAGTRGSAESLVQFTVIQDTHFSGSPVPKLNFSQLNTPPARGDSCLQGQANSGRLSMKESVLESCSVGTETNSVPVKLSPEDPGKLLSTGIRESFKRLASSEEATGDDHGKSIPFTLATGAVVDAHGSPAASAAAEVKLVDNEVPSLSPPEHATRALAMALRQFCPRAQVELAEVGSRAEEMQRRARELAHYFCENPGPATQETIMATLREFICLLVSSYKALLSKKARKGRLSNKPHDAGLHPARPKLEDHGRSRPLPGPPPPPERLLLHNLLPPPDHPRAGATARSRIKIGQKLQTPYGLGAVQAYRRIDDVLVVDLGWSMCYLGGLLNNVWEPTEEVGLQLGKKNVHTKAKEGVATPRNHSQHTKKRSIGFLTNTSLGHAQSVGKDMLAKSKTPSETTRCKKGLAFPASGASPLLVCDRMLVDDLVAQKEDNTSIMNSKAAAIDSLMPSQLKPQITSQSFSTSHHIMASIDREILNSLKDLRLAHSMTQSSAFGASKIMSRKPQLNFSTARRTLHFQPNLDVKESSGQMQTEGSDCLDGFDASISGSVGNVVFGDHYDLGAANSGSNNKMNLTCSTLLCGIDRDQGQQGRAVQVSTRQKRLSF